MKHTCPVCGNPDLTRPPKDHLICPCCGTQFDLDDYGKTHAELREEWYSCGAGWFSDRTLAPPGWSADEQLKAAGLEVKQ